MDTFRAFLQDPFDIILALPIVDNHHLDRHTLPNEKISRSLLLYHDILKD